MRTQYERYKIGLDTDRISREINSSGTIIARGVSAPYEGAPTPCVTETFSFKERGLQYVFTDALTGCAGLIAISGNVISHTVVFKPENAIIIHDKGGDKLESSEKLLDDFILAQEKAGHTRIRLLWGNGVVKGEIAPTHTHDTNNMIQRLTIKYPHLDIKHLPGQMALVADDHGNPINLSRTPLSEVPMMETICRSDIDIHTLADLTFERPFQRDFKPTHTEEPLGKPIDQIKDALHAGKFPPIWLIQSDRAMKSYLDDQTAKIPSGPDESHYSELINKIERHPNALVREIGAQLNDYKIKCAMAQWGTSKDPGKAELMSRKWWTMLFMATELMEGLEKKPVRSQLFDKEFLKTGIPRSMDGILSKTASNLVAKVDKEFILSPKIQTIDGSKKPERTAEHDAVTPGKGRDESLTFKY